MADMHESLHTALIELGFRARELEDYAPALARELIAAGWTPPGTSAEEIAQQITERLAGRDIQVTITDTVPSPEPAAELSYAPTVVTESVAGPQGCTHRFGSGKWCALQAGHPLPHVPAAKVPS